MAVRPVYSAEIKFEFDKKGLDASLANIEGLVRGTVKNINSTISGMKFDMPDFGAGVGKLGGLSKTTDKLAKQVRSVVRDAFRDIEDVTDVGIDKALVAAADRIGTTSDKIISRLGRMTDESGKEFRRLKEDGIREGHALYMALVGGSIFSDLADETVAKFTEMASKSSSIFKSMVSNILSSTSRFDDLDVADDIGNLSASIDEAFSGGANVVSEGVSHMLRTGISPLSAAMNKLIDITETVGAELKSTTTEINTFGESVRDARDASIGFGKSGIGTAAVLAFGEGAKRASSAVMDVKTSLSDVKIAATEAFRLKKLPVELMGIEGVRREIARVEETLARMPDKTSASFKSLQRSFSEVRSEAIKTQKQFEKGLVDEEQLTKSAEKLKDITNEIRRFKTTEISRLTEQLDRNSEAISLTGRTFSEKLKDIRDGISLTSETGGNKLLSLRLAMFGVGEATGPVSKLLDRFTNKLDDVGKAEGRLAEITARTTSSLSSQNNAIKSSITAIRGIAKVEGLHSSALDEVDKQINDVQNAYEAMTTTIEATGKATPQQVSRVRQEYKLLEESIKLVKIQNKDAIGPDTLRALGDLESRIKSNIPATRVLAATLNSASDAVDKVKKNSAELGGNVSKATGIFKRFKNIASGVTKTLGLQAKATDEVAENTIELSEVMERVGIEFFGALGANVLLGVFDKVTNAVSNMTSSIGSQIDKETQRITNAFGLLPSEAEAVSGSLADVWEANLGGSIDEVGEATQRAIARFKELGVTSQSEISSVTKDAFRMSEAYKFDVSDSLDATAVLMKQFNLTTKQSTDFLAGLGKEGIIGSDALDSVLEYSTQIKSAGGNADTLFNIIKTGFAGGGALGTDKAVDLFKEFRLQMSSGSDDVKKALNEIGIDSAQLMAQLGDGTITVTDAFEFVSGKLSQINDDTAVTRLGAALMGTQFEDLGNQMSLSISTVGTSMSELAGSSDSLAVKYTDLGSGMEAINRNLQVTFAPVNAALMSLAMQAIPPIMAGLESLRPIVSDLAARLNVFLSALGSGDWGAAGSMIVGVVADMAEGISSVLVWLVESGFDWGANFVVQIANGLIETASQVIVEAMDYIGNMISSFMAPGSPPEEGPLSDMDTWGTGLMATFGKGFKSADFKFVDQALAPIKSHFEKAFGKEGFDAFEGVRDQFTKIVAKINTTGIIDKDKFKEIETAIGPANAQLTKMLAVQLKLKKSQKDLADTQRDVSDAEAAGFVSENLKEKLKSAEQEVDVAKENVEWQKEFLKFQSLSKDNFGGMAKGAAKLGSAAAGGARMATKAIKGAVDKQLEFIKGGFDKEKALLEQKFEAGLIKEDEYLKQLIKLEEKYVDTSLNKGLLSGTELSKWGERINTLKSSLDDVKATSKGIEPIGTALFGDIDDAGAGAEAGGGLLESAKGIGVDIATSISDGLIESSKEKLSEAFSSIGTSISTLVKEKIFDKLTAGQKETAGMIGSALLGIGATSLIARISLIASKVGALSGVAVRFSVIGTGIWLVWKNWDKILLGINTAVAYLTELWTDFSEKLGGSEEVFKLFSDIFANVKTVLTEIGTGLKDFVLDALAGESISFSDFIEIFDISGIDTGPITRVVDAFMKTVQEQVDKIKLSISFGGAEGEPQRVGGEMEDADPTKFEKIAENFTRIFNNLKQSILDIQTSFGEFMAEDRLGGQIAGLVNAITESWQALSLVIGGPLLVHLASTAGFLGKFLPILGPIATTLGKIIPIVGIATVVIGNFEKIWPPLETALGGAVLAVTGIVEALGGIFLLFDDETRQEGIEMFFTGVSDVIGGLQETFLGLGVAIANFFVSAVADISGGVASILEAFDLDAIAKPFRNVEEGLHNVTESFKTALDDAKAILSGLRSQVKTILFLVTKNFTDWASGIYDTVTGWFIKLWDDLVGNSIITDMIADIVSVFSGLGTSLFASLSLTITKVKSKFIDMKTAVVNKVTDLKDSAIAIIGDLSSGIASAFTGKTFDSMSSAFDTLKEGFASAKTSILLSVTIMTTLVRTKLAGVADFVTGKIEALKTFATEVGTFITGIMGTVSGLEFPTLDDIALSVQGVVDAFLAFTGIDLSSVATAIVDSITGIAASILPSLKPVLETMAAFQDFDLSTAMDDFDLSTIFGGLDITAIETAFSGLDMSAQMALIVEAMTTPFSDMATTAIEHMTQITDGLGSIFTDVDLSEEATAVALTVVTPLAQMGILSEGTAKAITTAMSNMFADVDLSTAMDTVTTTLTTGLSSMAISVGIKLFEFTTGFVEIITGIDVSEAITTLSESLTGGISTMLTNALTSVTGFATDFIEQVMSIPGKIKERISEFTDIGSLLSNVFGFGETDMMADVASEIAGGEGAIVAPVESTTDKIKSAWDGAYNWVVGDSVVPDMVRQIGDEFALMDINLNLIVTQTTLMIQTAFSNMAMMIELSISNMAFNMATVLTNFNMTMATDFITLSNNVITNVGTMSSRTILSLNTMRPAWVSTFTRMTAMIRLFGTTGRQTITMLDDMVRKLTGNVDKLRASLVDAKGAMDELRDSDLENLEDSFAHMEKLVRKTRDHAKKFKKFMEAARDAAKDIGDTLGGNVGGAPSAQHGAWEVPRNQMMFIHKKETVLPPAVADDFRALMLTLQEAGIGGKTFNIPTGSPDGFGGVKSSTTIITNNIRNEFPNVGSAEDAAGIEEALNIMIDNARRFARIGGA